MVIRTSLVLLVWIMNCSRNFFALFSLVYLLAKYCLTECPLISTFFFNPMN